MISLPKTTGISLKPEHYNALLGDKINATDWLEIHPENYMGEGGAPHAYLEKIRANYALSMHGVGMSLGSADGVDVEHLKRLKLLCDRYQPDQVSEHLSWSHWNSTFLNDLLPLPYTNESLNIICENIDRVQSALGRKILIENPSTYIDFAEMDFDETSFFRKIVEKSGCGILLDINNVFVSSFNNGFDPYKYVDNFPKGDVNEVHLAGHSLKKLTTSSEIRIDDHGSRVKDEVWALYDHFLKNTNHAIPTLVEWDTDVPEIDILLEEAEKANQHMRLAIASESTPQQ